MGAFERSAVVLPGLAELYAWPGWTTGGSIGGGDSIVTEDLDGDGRDDIAVHFSQFQNQAQEGNWGKTVTTLMPNRLVVFLAQPDGTFVDATAELFGSPEPVVLPGYSRKVDVGDLNGDGRPDWVYALNQEDGRATDDIELIEATSAAVLSQPGNGYRVVTFGEPDWHHAARIYVSEGVGHVLAQGFTRPDKTMIGDWNEVFVWTNDAFVVDETGSSLVAAGEVPSSANTFVVLPPDQPGGIASQVVTVVQRASTGATHNYHPALLELDATGQWTIADYRLSFDTEPVPVVAWNGYRGTTGLAMIDGMPLMIPHYPESALLRPTPGEDPVAMMWLQGLVLPQPREDGYYYENDGQWYMKLEFYRAVDGQLLDADIRIAGERTFPGSIFSLEVLDVNADGLEDIVTYPLSVTARPDVYLNLGNREFMRLDDAVLPAGPLWGSPAFPAGTARFLDANGDGVQDLLYFPRSIYAQFVDGSNWEVHLGTTNRLADFDTRAIEIADRRGGTLIATWGGDDVLSDTNAAATDSRLDGGAGLDIATYSGAAAQYQLGPADHHEWRVTRPGNVTDTLANIERLQFSDHNVALDIDGNGGQAYRLYQAAFDRVPDLAGVGYWIAQRDAGKPLFDIATGFIDSEEFKAKYGQETTNEQYTLAVYTNVLHRAPDQAGYDYWNKVLNGDPVLGQTTRQQMLIDFSESPENKANVIGVIGNGFDYIEWV